MHLTIYTDYTLRVMVYLAVKYPQGDVTTISEMAKSYDISRNHLMKIVHELSQHGFIETTRGRTGGARLARPPAQISVGQIVRMAEKDFSAVPCHRSEEEAHCMILPACNLRRVMYRAVDAFLHELDKTTLEDTIIAPSVAASLLGISGIGQQGIRVPLPTPGAWRKRQEAAASSKPRPRGRPDARARSGRSRSRAAD